MKISCSEDTKKISPEKEEHSVFSHEQIVTAKEICNEVVTQAEKLSECYKLLSLLDSRENAIRELLEHTENVLRDDRATTYQFQISYAVAQERYKNLQREIVNIQLYREALLSRIKKLEEKGVCCE